MPSASLRAAAAFYVLAALALPYDVVLRFRFGVWETRLSHFAFGLMMLLLLSQTATRAGLASLLRRAWPAAPYVTAVLLSAVGTLNPVRTLGYTIWALFNMVAIVVGVQLLRDSGRRTAWLARAHLAGGIPVCVVAAIEIAVHAAGGTWPYASSGTITDAQFPRLNAFLYVPGALSFYVVGLLSVTLTWLVTRPQGAARRLRMMAVAFTAVVLLSTSRGGTIGVAAAFAAALVFGIAMRLAWRPLLVRLCTVGLSALAVTVLVIAGFVLIRATSPDSSAVERLSRIGPTIGQILEFELFGSDFARGSAIARVSDTAEALSIWRERPLFGVGIGGYGAYAATRGFVPPGVDVNDWVGQNAYTEVLAETGLAGLLGAALLVGVIAWRSLRSDEPVAKAYGVALLVVALAMFPSNATFLRLDYWTLLGLAAAASGAERSTARAQRA